MKQIIIVLAALFFSGCTIQMKQPVELERDTLSTTINQGIIKRGTNKVPLDVYLTSQEWRASLSIDKGRYYIPNNKMVKTFYYAHHAYRIKITGDSNLIRKYKNYFQRNAVTAKICLEPIHRRNKYRVDMIFSHLYSDTELDCEASTNKDVEMATSPVIKI